MSATRCGWRWIVGVRERESLCRQIQYTVLGGEWLANERQGSPDASSVLPITGGQNGFHPCFPRIRDESQWDSKASSLAVKFSVTVEEGKFQVDGAAFTRLDCYLRAFFFDTGSWILMGDGRWEMGDGRWEMLAAPSHSDTVEWLLGLLAASSVRTQFKVGIQ
jgi:hypothetical protein